MQEQPQARDLWFLDTWVTLRRLSSEGPDGVSIMEIRQPFGGSPPRHVHEDEIFHLLEGRIRFWVGDREFDLEAGQTCVAPKGVPHTFKVISKAGARTLTMVVGNHFETFVRKLSRPAAALALPEPLAPTPEAIQALVAAGTESRITFIAPPAG